MVKKTRRASKISKRRKNNTRSKGGRGHGRRTVKRGGMKKHAAHAAHAARSAHAAAAGAGHAHKPSISGNPHTHTHTPGYTPRAPFLEVVGQQLNKKFEDPVEMGSSYMGAHNAAMKELHNKNVHDSLGTPVCLTKYSQFGPSVAGQPSIPMSNPGPPNYVYSTPSDASSYLRSPPPPTTDLFVRGTGIPVMYNNSMDLAPGAPGTHPAGVVRSLDADFDMLPAPAPAPLPPIAPVAPMSDVRSPPYTFPRANRNSMNRMNCNKNSGSP